MSTGGNAKHAWAIFCMRAGVCTDICAGLCVSMAVCVSQYRKKGLDWMFSEAARKICLCQGKAFGHCQSWPKG